jgi:hypothetical protein
LGLLLRLLLVLLVLLLVLVVLLLATGRVGMCGGGWSGIWWGGGG